MSRIDNGTSRLRAGGEVGRTLRGELSDAGM